MNSKSDIIDSVRKMAISRRGGVRTRGGRLPPINLRELAQVTGKKETKKTIAPTIPQRRRIKQEVDVKAEPLETFERKKPDFQAERDRGRGRQHKAVIQTGGTFLAEGPAARIKKDPLAYESFSIPCYSKSSAASGNSSFKFSEEELKELLGTYNEFGAYEDEDCWKPPYRLPLLKSKRTKKPASKVTIKKEPGEDGIKQETIKIKEEVKTENEDGDDDDEDTKEKVIKTEKDIKKENDEDDEDDFIGRRKIKIKKEVISDSEDEDDASKTKKDVQEKKVEEVEDFDKEVESTANFIQSVEGKGKMIMLQIPSHTTAPEAEKLEGNPKDKKQGLEDKPEQVSTFLDNLEEGYIGKLQIMKSGKMRLKLGPMEYEILDGSPSESYWEAVSIQIRDDGTGDMAVLGKVERKLMLTPVLEMLLEEEKSTEGKKD